MTSLRTRSLERLDLEPLYRECFLRSDVRRETYDCIATELCDYGLSWGGKRVDAHAHRARAGRVSAYAMGYGDEVTIRPSHYGDFMLVHVSLRNGIAVEADGETVHVPEGRAYLSAPRRSVRLRWQEGCEQLLIRVPLDLLGAGQGRAAAVRSGVIVPDALQPLLVDHVNMLLKIARLDDEVPQRSAWADWLEDGLGRLLGQQLVEDWTRPAPAPRREPEPGADRRDRIERFIARHLDVPVSLDDLAAAAGLRRSQLNQVCRDAWGCSPMAHLRRRRLEAARDDLARRPEQDLTQLSLRYGFEHQSRFAQYWRAAFGELPSETRRRHR